MTAVGTDAPGTFTEYQVDNLPSAAGGSQFQINFHPGSGTWDLDDVAFTSTPGPAVQSDLGNISFTDTNATETHAAVAVAENGGHHTDNTAYLGTFTLDPVSTGPNGSGFVGWHFNVNNSDLQSLAQGQTLTQKYDVTISDNHGGSTEQTVTVSLVGQNDNPVIQPPGLADPGPFQIPAGTPDGKGGYVPVTASNNFGYTDPDLTDTHTISSSFDGHASNLGALDAPIGEFSATPLSDSTGGNQGIVHWSFTLNSTDLLLLNNAGLLPNIDEVYDVTVSDGHGGTAIRQIPIVINGSTLPALAGTITGASGPVSNSNQPATASALYQLQGATITGSTGNGVSLQSNDNNASDFLVAQADAASSIAVTGNNFNGINLTSTGASIVAFNAASSITATGTGSIGINASGNGNVAVNDLPNTSVSGGKFGIDATIAERHQLKRRGQRLC